MIKKLRLKFVAVTMGIIIFLLLVIGGVILGNMVLDNNREADMVLEKMLENYSRKQAPGPVGGRDALGNFRGFVAKLDKNGEISDISFDSFYFTEEEVRSVLAEIVESRSEKGSSGDFRYMRVNEPDGGALIAATDRTIENDMLSSFTLSLVAFGGGGIALLFLTVWLLSYWVIKPVSEAFDKQKRFVSDAGHELKTPLTIISANADILAAETGKNTWVDGIKEQSERMKNLIGDLITLAKIDETENVKRASFDLSRTLLTAVLPFESVAYEQNKTLDVDIPDGIFYEGSEEDVKRAVLILMDNAVKYSSLDGGISMALKNGDRRSIEVFSSGKCIEESQKSKIFERFYRIDESRTRETGGSGLGLSIVKRLAETNGWKLQIRTEEGKGNTFVIYL